MEKHIILLQTRYGTVRPPQLVMIEQPGRSIHPYHLRLSVYQQECCRIVIAAELLVDKIGCSIFGSLFPWIVLSPPTQFCISFPGSLVIILYSDSGIFRRIHGMKTPDSLDAQRRLLDISFLVCIIMTPVGSTRAPYKAAEAASFNTEIDSISSGLMETDIPVKNNSVQHIQARSRRGMTTKLIPRIRTVAPEPG